MVPAQRPWSATADKSQQARSRDKRELVEVLDAITSPLARALREGKGKSALAGARIAGPAANERQAPEGAIFESQAATSRVCVDIRAGLRQPYSKG